MEEKIKDLFATILRTSTDTISDKTAPGNLESWDSFQHLTLVSGFEEEFDIEIEPEEIPEMYKDFQSFKKNILQKL